MRFWFKRRMNFFDAICQGIAYFGALNGWIWLPIMFIVGSAIFSVIMERRLVFKYDTEGE